MKWAWWPAHRRHCWTCLLSDNSSSSRIFAIVKCPAWQKNSVARICHTNGEAQQYNEDPPSSASWLWEWRCAPHDKFLLLCLSIPATTLKLERRSRIYLPLGIRHVLVLSHSSFWPSCMYVFIRLCVCTCAGMHACVCACEISTRYLLQSLPTMFVESGFLTNPWDQVFHCLS